MVKRINSEWNLSSVLVNKWVFICVYRPQSDFRWYLANRKGGFQEWLLKKNLYSWVVNALLTMVRFWKRIIYLLHWAQWSCLPFSIHKETFISVTIIFFCLFLLLPFLQSIYNLSLENKMRQHSREWKRRKVKACASKRKWAVAHIGELHVSENTKKSVSWGQLEYY